MEIRSSKAEDIGFIEAMLFEAFFWDVRAERPTYSAFRQHPEFAKLVSGWGRRGDRGVVAEDGGRQLGAAWFRLWTTELHSYGFVDAATPELGIAVAQVYRRQGIGRALLRELIVRARADGFSNGPTLVIRRPTQPLWRSTVKPRRFCIRAITIC